MKLHFTTAFAAAIMLITLSSCSSSERLASRYPYISHLNNTDCLDSRAIDDYNSDDIGTTFEMTISGNTAECIFKSLIYSDPGK